MPFLEEDKVYWWLGKITIKLMHYRSEYNDYWHIFVK